jgi:hypothetical protein
MYRSYCSTSCGSTLALTSYVIMGSTPVSTNDRELERARALARALDAAVRIPGTPIRIGLDAILGLIPGGGDIAGAALSGYIVLLATRRGVPPEVIWRMLGNVAVDTVIGSVPVIGDLFDVGYKSNIKNVELLERHTIEPAAVAQSSRRLGVLVVAVVALLLIGVATVGFLLARLIWRLLSG